MRRGLHVRRVRPFEHGPDRLEPIVRPLGGVGLAIAQEADRGRSHPMHGEVRVSRFTFGDYILDAPRPKCGMTLATSCEGDECDLR